jgi:hypothetical protein
VGQPQATALLDLLPERGQLPGLRLHQGVQPDGVGMGEGTVMFTLRGFVRGQW